MCVGAIVSSPDEVGGSHLNHIRVIHGGHSLQGTPHSKTYTTSADPVVTQKRIDELNAMLAAEGKTIIRWKSIPQGAATSVWAGVVASAEEVGGRYCENCHVVEPSTDGSFVDGASPHAFDPETAKALWAKSEELVGEKF